MAEYRCEECDRDFKGKQSLDDHNKAKHPVVKKKSLSLHIKGKYIVFLILIIFLNRVSVNLAIHSNEFSVNFF